MDGEYKKGDIITFEAPSKSILSPLEANNENPVAIYNTRANSIIYKFFYYVLEFDKISYIKRVIGTKGDHIKIADGKVYLNDKRLKEDYLEEDIKTEGGVYSDIIVPDGHVFVMGDNRLQSTDSRYFGCVPTNKIESKVWIRFWPLNKFGEV